MAKARGDSAFRNAIPRRSHKERSQPAARQRLGLLEKHKDYVLRAKDFHRKEDTLRLLREKAALKNPDEFYFRMQNSRIQDGVHVDLSKPGSSNAKATLAVKNKDLNYLHLKAQVDSKKIDSLKSGLHFMDVQDSMIAEGVKKGVSKHKIFLDNAEEVANFNAEEHFDTIPELISHPSNRIRKSTLEERAIAAPKDSKAQKQLAHQRAVPYAELAARMKRKEALHSLISDLETHKNLMGKGKRRKIAEQGRGRPAVYKWTSERKK